MNPEQVGDALGGARKTSRWTWTVARGYAGWLLTCPTFVQEHDQLFKVWADEVRKWGIPELGPVVPPGEALPGTERICDGRLPQFVAAFEAFFVRWRLSGLAAPYLPNPMRPLFLGQLPVSILGQLLATRGLFFVPDTFPIPSRDEFRGLLEDALRHGQGLEHLNEWVKIVQQHNLAKNSIPRFARLFEIQHYERIMRERHPAAPVGRRAQFEAAVACFLETSYQTVRRDFQFIHRRLGMNRRRSDG